MATAADIYGRIGAAKAFSSSVSNSLDDRSDDRQQKIDELERQIEETDNPKEKAKLQKKKKRLERRNKMNNNLKKASDSSTDFLTKLAAYLDITIEVIAQFIAHIIVIVLPALEVTVKMLLLSNIKRMVGCSIDPRIPDEWRTVGVIINEAQIDPRQILSESPFTKWGKYLYFGVFDDVEAYSEEDTQDNAIVGMKDVNMMEHKNLYELARAEDMNAFLWFAKYNGRFVSPNIIPDASTYFDVDGGVTLYNTQEFKEKAGNKYIEGSSFKIDSDSQTTFLCENVYRGDDDNDIYVIVPATDRWTGVTWYKDRTNITGSRKKNEIDYTKSKPLFNIEYLNPHDPEFTLENYLYPDGNFRFRILPKPFSTAGGFISRLNSNVDEMSGAIAAINPEEVIGGEIVKNGLNFQYQGIQSPIPYYAKFNADGKFDKRGKYSINTLKYDVFLLQNNTNNGQYYYEIRNKLGGGQPLGYLLFEKKSKSFSLVTSPDSEDSEEMSFVDKMKILTECYGGLTVYEFNYDYVVSMRLFDEKSIALQIVDALMNINLPNLFKRSKKNGKDDARTTTDQIMIDSYVDKLVEKMIDNEEREFTDCFYTFSNEDYEAMEKSVADKIANMSFVTDDRTNAVTAVYDIIDAYDADATLHERTETISMAIRKAAEACGFEDNADGSGVSDTIQNGQFPKTSNNGTSQNFITQLIQFLISAIVNSLLTPKVLMLIQVNRMMMGNEPIPRSVEEFKDRYNYNLQDILNGLSGLLKDLIREIINIIQKELLRMILQKLTEILTTFLKKLGLEFAMKWVALIKQIFSCFSFGRKKSKMSVGGYLEEYTDSISTIINNVDYADINQSIDEIIPQTNPC